MTYASAVVEERRDSISVESQRSCAARGKGGSTSTPITPADASASWQFRSSTSRDSSRCVYPIEFWDHGRVEAIDEYELL